MFIKFPKLNHLLTPRKLVLTVMALTIGLFSAAPVFAHSGDASAGAVYLQSNDPNGNQVLVFHRAYNGALSFEGSFATGGTGSGVGITVPPDPLGSQNSILASADGRWVFTVNAGSNEVSVLKTGKDDKLTLTDKVSSGGDYPVSLTYRDGILYILNAAGDGNITGFYVTDNGHLKMIKGSSRSLYAATPANGAQPQILESPAEVGFSPDGRFLVITDKGGVSGKGLIHVFKVSDNRPSASDVITQTAGAVPFDFAFDRFGHLVVVDASTGSVTSYSIWNNGSLSVNSTVFTGQAATCWIARTPDGKELVTDNTGSGTLSGFTTDRAGQLAPVTPNSIIGVAGNGTLPLDMGISQDGQYEYSLETGVGKIGVFHINSDGTLTAMDTAGSYPAVGGFQGIAVR